MTAAGRAVRKLPGSTKPNIRRSLTHPHSGAHSCLDVRRWRLLNVSYRSLSPCARRSTAVSAARSRANRFASSSVSRSIMSLMSKKTARSVYRQRARDHPTTRRRVAHRDELQAARWTLILFCLLRLSHARHHNTSSTSANGSTFTYSGSPKYITSSGSCITSRNAC